MSVSYIIQKTMSNPLFYSIFIRIVGASRNKPTLINDYIRPVNGNQLLDFGCGPANLLDYLPQDIAYTGMDFNEEYIEHARQKYGERGTFISGDVTDKINESFIGQFDIVLAHGLIHHLSDDQTKILLENGYKCLNKNGRLITVDNVYDDEINIINKIALKMDRGAYIRNKPEYLDLFSQFPEVRCNVIKTKLRIPYYHIICEIIKND